jgi:beta-amylase
MVKSLIYSAIATLTAATDVFVMLPLNTVSNSGSLSDKSGLASQLDTLKDAGVDGFMADMWWGVTEPSAKSYSFDAYEELVSMAKDRGMKVQFVTSFHQCGGNVGDECDIPIPSFARGQSGVWYKDQDGNEDKEYLSLFADGVKISGRTPLEMYSDWFGAFSDAFSGDIGSTITELQVGMGPAGELRYPAYQLAHWSFCGVGAFQVWDDHALASFRSAASAAGHSEWDLPPTDAGNYNSQPGDTSFFTGGYQSEYGKFFLDWYFQSLKDHGDAVLGSARSTFGNRLALAAKVSGIHWWYKISHHASELTAGYYNANQRDAYAELAEMFAKHDTAVDFTCLEMKDSEQPSSCASGPEELVNQVASAAQSKGTHFNGENALPRYDSTAYNQIASYKGRLTSFTYLRLSNDLLQGSNLNNFKNFVSEMHSGEALV